MANDGSDSATFTVRLVDQVMAPSRSIKASLGQVNKAFADTKRAIEAPMPKRTPLSDFDKMLSKAKLSQAKDFGAQHMKAVKAGAKQQGSGGFLSDLFGELAPAAVAGGAAGIAAAAIGEIIDIAKQAALAVFDIGKAFIGASFEAAKFADHATLAIGYLTANAGGAGAVFDDVRHDAQSLGLNVEETVGSFQKLLAAQFSVGQSKSLIKMGADMQAIGASGEEVQRILYAMSEIKSIGTLQKRQERMLQMAGISGQLIDQALMKRMNIKTPGGLDKARKGNKIGADVATAAIMDAVMHKVNESKLGDVGKQFADTSLEGMQNQLSSGISNFFMDVGEKIKPGLLELAGLVKGTLGVLADDPQLANFGQFLLNEFELFVGWAKTNWPQIQDVLVNGLHDLAGAIRFVIESLDAGTAKGQLFYGMLRPLADLVRAQIYIWSAFATVIEWTAEALMKVRSAMPGGGQGSPGSSGFGGAVTGAASGLPLIGPAVAGFNMLSAVGSANDNSDKIQGVTASGGIQALQTMPATATEGGEPRAGDRNVDMSGMQIHLTVKEDDGPEAMAQKIHTEVAKMLRQAG